MVKLAASCACALVRNFIHSVDRSAATAISIAVRYTAEGPCETV